MGQPLPPAAGRNSRAIVMDSSAGLDDGCAAVAVTGGSRINARCLQCNSHSSAIRYACLVANPGCAAEVAGKTAHRVDVNRSRRQAGMPPCAGEQPTASTLELRCERRCGARPVRRMMDHSGKRAKCHADASRLRQRARHD